MGKFVVWTLLAVSAALLGIAAWDAFNVGRLVATGVRTEGRVCADAVSVSKSVVGSGSGDHVHTTKVHTPVVQFRDEVGKSHELRAAPTLGAVLIGDAASVYYPTGRPDDGRAFVAWAGAWSAFMAVAAVLVAGLGLGLHAFLRYRTAVRRSLES